MSQIDAASTSPDARDTMTLPASDGRAIGYLCACVVVVLFSGFTLVSRMGLKSSLTLMDIAALRFTVAGVVLMPIFVRSWPIEIPLRELVAIVVLGGFGFALLAYAGFALAPASHGAVLLHGTLPLFTFILVMGFSQRGTGRRRDAGIALITGGIVMMVGDSLSNASARQLVGDGALLLASLCWSSYAIRIRRLQLGPARAASIVAVVSMCCFLPVYLLVPGKALFAIDLRELLLQAAFQGIFIGALSIYVYTRAVASLGASQTALFTAAVPCLTTIGAGPLLLEYPSLSAAIGAGIVTIGMIVAMTARTPP